MERDYYVAAGRSLAAIKAWDVVHKNYFDEVLTLMSANGIHVLGENQHRFYTNDGRFAGWHIPLDHEVPPLFSRWPKQPECVSPSGKSKAGRALQKQLRDLKAPTMTSLCYDMCGAWDAWSGPNPGGHGLIVAAYRLETYGEQQILSCPAGGRAPYDAEPLLRSTYWAMREAVDAEKAPEHEAVAPA